MIVGLKSNKMCNLLILKVYKHTIVENVKNEALKHKKIAINGAHTHTLNVIR